MSKSSRKKAAKKKANKRATKKRVCEVAVVAPAADHVPWELLEPGEPEKPGKPQEPKSIMDVILAVEKDVVLPSQGDKDFRIRCRVALGEFQRRTGLRLWLRYHTIGDIDMCRRDHFTGKLVECVSIQKGHPSGCAIAFCDPTDEQLYMGSAFCTSLDRKRYSRNVGRWRALSKATPVPWGLSTKLRVSVELARELTEEGLNLPMVADFHHWMCRKKIMALETATNCVGQFIDTAPTVESLEDITESYSVQFPCGRPLPPGVSVAA